MFIFMHFLYLCSLIKQEQGKKPSAVMLWFYKSFRARAKQKSGKGKNPNINNFRGS